MSKKRNRRKQRGYKLPDGKFTKLNLDRLGRPQYNHTDFFSHMSRAQLAPHFTDKPLAKHKLEHACVPHEVSASLKVRRDGYSRLAIKAMEPVLRALYRKSNECASEGFLPYLLAEYVLVGLARGEGPKARKLIHKRLQALTEWVRYEADGILLLGWQKAMPPKDYALQKAAKVAFNGMTKAEVEKLYPASQVKNYQYKSTTYRPSPYYIYNSGSTAFSAPQRGKGVALREILISKHSHPQVASESYALASQDAYGATICGATAHAGAPKGADVSLQRAFRFQHNCKQAGRHALGYSYGCSRLSDMDTDGIACAATLSAYDRISGDHDPTFDLQTLAVEPTIAPLLDDAEIDALEEALLAEEASAPVKVNPTATPAKPVLGDDAFASAAYAKPTVDALDRLAMLQDEDFCAKIDAAAEAEEMNEEALRPVDCTSYADALEHAHMESNNSPPSCKQVLASEPMTRTSWRRLLAQKPELAAVNPAPFIRGKYTPGEVLAAMAGISRRKGPPPRNLGGMIMHGCRMRRRDLNFGGWLPDHKYGQAIL